MTSLGSAGQCQARRPAGGAGLRDVKMTASAARRGSPCGGGGSNYPRYMSKVNAHYERIDPRNGVRSSVPGVDSIVMCIVKVNSERIDHRNLVSHSVSGVNPFIMRIYFAHVTGVTVFFPRVVVRGMLVISWVSRIRRHRVIITFNKIWLL